jgi:hypothetical protein
MYMRGPTEYAPVLAGEQGEVKKPGGVTLQAAIGTAVLLAMVLTVALGLWPGPVARLVTMLPLG